MKGEKDKLRSVEKKKPVSKKGSQLPSSNALHAEKLKVKYVTFSGSQ